MLFQDDPSPQEEVQRSTGPRLFLELLGHESGALLKINLTFLLTCLPVVTIPPAIYALNGVMRGIVQDKPGRVGVYLRSLRENFLRAWGAFLLSALPLFAAGYGVSFYLGFAAENWLAYLPFMLCSTIFLVTLLASTYLYGLLADGRRLGRDTVALALTLGVGKPLRAVLAAAAYYGPLLVSVLFFPLSGIYLLLIGFSLPCLLGNFFLRTVLDLCRGTD